MRLSIITPTLILSCAMLGALCLVQTGCSVLKPKADNTRLYVLRAQPATPALAAESRATKPVVRVGPGRLAAYLDVTPVVVIEGLNTVKQLDSHQWAEPLPKGISRVFSEDLAQRLNGAQIIVYPEPANGAALEVRYSINRLEGALDGPIFFQVTWQVVDLTSGEALRAGTTAREIAATNRTEDVSAYAERISAAIGIWADDVAAAVRALPVDRQP